MMELTTAKADTCRCYGWVRDAEDGEALIGASVWLPALPQGTITNEHGFYSLPLPCDRTLIVIYQQIGYQNDTLRVHLDPLSPEKRLDVQLSLQSLSTVTITAAPTRIYPGLPTPSVERLHSAPAFLGERDLLRALVMLPGVAQGVEGTTGLHVRGSTPDQTLQLLDGSTVYNTGHIFGFVSVFNPTTIKSIQLYKDYLPPSYGDRLAGVLDLQMKDGNRYRREQHASLGLLTASYTTEAPLAGQRGSFLLGARISHSGVITLGSLPAYASGGPLVFAGMYDLNAKVSYQMKGDALLQASFYAGDDIWGTLEGVKRVGQNQSIIQWGNRTVALRYSRPLGTGWFSTTQMNYNTYANGVKAREITKLEEGNQINAFGNRGAIGEIGVTQTLTGNVRRHTLQLGLRVRRQRFEPSRIMIRADTFTFDFPRNSVVPFRINGQIEDRIELGKRWSTLLGLHLAGYLLAERDYRRLSTEPRLALNYHIDSTRTISLSYNRTYQYSHLIGVIANNLPYDFWLPATGRLPAERAHAYSLSLLSSRTPYLLGAALYYRSFDGQVALAGGRNLIGDTPSNEAWENVLTAGGTGQAYGFELYIERAQGRLTGSLAYTYARSFRRFNNINDGRTFPYDFDRPHDLFLNANWKLSERWSCQINFVLQSGRPVTAPRGSISDFDGNWLPLYTTRNDYRLPLYHRLDFNFSKTYQTRKRGRSATLSFGAYNVYGQRNIVYISPYGIFEPGRIADADFLVPAFDARSLFRFIPSFNYSLSW